MNNYLAWSVSGEFPSQGSDLDKLFFLCKYAILSPSGHNSQPWHIKSSKDSIDIMLDKQRFIQGENSEIMSIEPYVSLGTFIETMEYAAKGCGLEIAISYFPDENIVFNVSISRSTVPKPQNLDHIKQRVSNRLEYKKEKIDSSKIALMSDPVSNNVEVFYTDDDNELEWVSVKTFEAMINLMSSRDHKKELTLWVRNNFTKKYDGMPGFTHGIGPVSSFFAKNAIKFLPSKKMAKKSKKLMMFSGGVFIVGSNNSSKKLASIDLGRQYAKICLVAESYGLSTSGLGASAMISHTRDQLIKHFDIGFKPSYIIRIGRAKKINKHSPRWPVELVSS